MTIKFPTFFMHAILFLLFATYTHPAQALDNQTSTLQLAIDLARENEYDSSALEFRRAALDATNPIYRANFYWAAANEYLKAEAYQRTDKMLDHAENESQEIELPSLILRGKKSYADKQWDEAIFYFKSAWKNNELSPYREAIARNMIAIKLEQGHSREAYELLSTTTPHDQQALDALEAYQMGSDKSPKLGGWLGIIPGLGYAYAGEYANALRSLILNGIFLYGAIDTAQDNEWGAFTVISFFELTWFSGSIYGGIDASHRNNRNRLDKAIESVQGENQSLSDYTLLPAAVLRIDF